MAGGTEIVSSLPQEAYDPAIGEDIISDLPPEGGEDFERAAERRASRLGWTPYAQFTGDPAKWMKASEWLNRADEVLPLLRAHNRKMEKVIDQQDGAISDLRRTVEDQGKALQDMRKLAQRANEQGYQRALQDLRAKQREAVQAGDLTAFDQLVEQEEALTASREDVAPAAAEPEPAPAPAPAPRLDQDTLDFVERNKWFNSDPVLTRDMIDYHKQVIREGQITNLAEQLEEAKARLIEAYPQKFAPARRAEEPPAPAPRPRQAPVQEPRPRRQAPPRNDGQPGLTLASISDPAERQEATESFRRFQRNMPDYTEAEYMTVYNQPHTNILDVQAKLRRKPANG